MQTITITKVEGNEVHYLLITYHHNGRSEEAGTAELGKEIIIKE